MSKVVELELPAVYLDPVVLDTSGTRLRLVNRNPEPLEVDVPADTDISFLLIDTAVGGGGAAMVSPTRVYVNGVLAYTGATNTFSVGFDGPSSAATAVGNTLAIYIDRTGLFASQQVVTVRVVSATDVIAGPMGVLDETYSFTIVDSTAPQVTAAQATGHRTVVVAFNEAMKELGDGSSADALTPGNWAIVPQALPAVAPAVVRVRALTSTTVELTVDMDLSQRVTYRVTATNAQDMSGNAVVAPFNTALFVAFACPAPVEREFSLYRMMPVMNRREDQEGTKDLEKFLACIQDVTDLQLCELDSWTDILDPDKAAEDFVDAMLADLGNPFSFDLTLEDKRRLVPLLVPIYKSKGTNPGIVNAVRFFTALEITIIPYTLGGMELGESELGDVGLFDSGTWELGPSGSFAAYAFNVTVLVLLTVAQRRQIVDIVNYMKPAHTHFVELIEPTPPVVIDHLELGLSELGVDFILH